MRFEPVHRAVVERDREPSEHGGRNVVGVPLDLRGHREDRDRVGVDPEVEQGRCRHHARDRCRGRRSQPALEWDQVPPAAGERGERERHPSRDRRHHPADQIRAVGGELVRPLPLPRDTGRGRRVDHQLVTEVPGQPEAVEPGAEVRRRGGDADRHAHRGAERIAARTTDRAPPRRRPHRPAR